MAASDELRLKLLNDWQRGFPLVARPFARLAAVLACSEDDVIAQLRSLRAEGALSRVGGVFSPGAGGAGALVAMAVPPQRLDDVAKRVSADPAVNHNYEREHAWNLWFVVHGRDANEVTRTIGAIEADTGLRALRLTMRRAYRIDLGFDLSGHEALSPTATRGEALAPVAAADRPLADLVEQGLPLLAEPYAAWARQLHRDAAEVTATLARWLSDGALRRFGVIVCHHELGFAANAMTVFDLPDAEVDACGAALASDARVTLAYRRERAPGWPYNLYCMVHGRDRDSVRATLAAVVARAGLASRAHQVLFSRRRFKQEGARRFAAATLQVSHA